MVARTHSSHFRSWGKFIVIRSRPVSRVVRVQRPNRLPLWWLDMHWHIRRPYWRAACFDSSSSLRMRARLGVLYSFPGGWFSLFRSLERCTMHWWVCKKECIVLILARQLFPRASLIAFGDWYSASRKGLADLGSSLGWLARHSWSWFLAFALGERAALKGEETI
jgi:hypothetical protein